MRLHVYLRVLTCIHSAYRGPHTWIVDLNQLIIRERLKKRLKTIDYFLCLYPVEGQYSEISCFIDFL